MLSFHKRASAHDSARVGNRANKVSYARSGQALTFPRARIDFGISSLRRAAAFSASTFVLDLGCAVGKMDRARNTQSQTQKPRIFVAFRPPPSPSL